MNVAGSVPSRTRSGTNTSSSNTSSSPNYMCGMCNSSTADDAIGCDLCPRWFCPTTMCTGLKLETINLIASDADNGIFYKCSICRCSNPPRSDNNVDSRGAAVSNSPCESGTVGQLFEMIRSLTILVTNLANQMSTVTSNSNANQFSSGNTSPVVNENLYAELWEFEERKKRRESLIIRGSGAQSNAQLSGIFEDISSELVGTRVTPDEIHCINSENSLYRVKLVNSRVRMNILENSRNLRGSMRFGQVYINRDLTYKQRQELRNRRLARNPASENISVHRSSMQHQIGDTGQVSSARQVVGSTSSSSNVAAPVVASNFQ